MNGFANQDPIFIIGTERSGSNLLRLILDSHPRIAIPHPPHIMRDFTGMIKSYGNLKHDNNFKALIGDVLGAIDRHFSPWPLKPTVEEILKQTKERSLLAIYFAIYEVYLNGKGKTRFGCKSTFMHWHINDILRLKPNAKFIHLVRDPRDVAVSASKSIFSENHPYFLAKLWKREQRNIFNNAVIESSNYLLIKYEDLILDPKNCVKKIMGFLNEDFLEEQMLFFKNEEANKLARLSDSWKNVSQPIDAKNSKKYKKYLTQKEIQIIETICKEEMKQLGYEFDQTEMSIDFNLSRISYYILDFMGFAKNECLALFRDKNFFLRWKKKMYFKKLKIKLFFRNLYEPS